MFYIFLILSQVALADPSSGLVNSTEKSTEKTTASDMDSGVGEPPALEPPVKEVVDSRTYDLSKKLRCPVCQGLSVADSRSDAAVAMKMRIQGLVESGYSDDQIVNYFIGRYGEWALLKPKYEHWFVWTAPIVASLFGFGFVGWRINRSRHFQKGSDSEEVADTNQQVEKEKSVQASSDESEQRKSYRERLLRELDD
jgi:cytochrome c-type biogenesis protein CcmH